MGTGAVGRNRAGSTKVGPDCLGGGMVLVDGKPSHLPRLVSEISHVSDAEMMMQERHRAESWSSKPNNGSRSSFKNEVKMGSQVKTRPVGRDLEGKVQSGMQVERGSSVVNHRESHRGKSMDNSGKVYKAETITYIEQPPQPEIEKEIQQNIDTPPSPYPLVENKKPFEIIEQVEEQMIEVESTNQPELDTSAATGEMSEAQAQNTEEAIVPTAEPVREEQPNEPEMKGDTTTEVVKEVQKEESEKALIVSEAATIVSEIPVEDKRENKPLETDKIESKHVHKGSKSHKHKSSKSSSRSRPGTATGSRPGVLSRGLRGLESPSPIEGIESTWPRRMMVRKRTVRQGGALHNLPILPPLPSVLSALEKRRPHGHHLHHHSENPLSNITNSTSIVGRCSLKEPSHFETGQGISPVGRASLKEQNLESWRVRDQDDMQRSRSREKSVEKELKMAKERKKDDRSTERQIQEDVVIVQKENVQINIEFIQEIKQDEVETSMEIRNESSMEIQPQTEQAKDIKVTISEDLGDQQANELEEIVAKFSIEEPEGETVRYRDDNDSWDDVLGMVNTLWDEGWEKARVEVGEGDADSLSGSLQRWPLLRPPVGFGGSHPPSSAASELSLTELERRARELDSDLEHLDLSQPHREGEELYPPLHESRERPDMYQTHPGPQRDKTTSLTGVGSRSQVNLELTSPTADSDRPPAGTSPAKEDSSPDSNLTLESDSSGIFLSLSNQSQEEAGSDSDQPISGSDLGSSSTSLDKDGDDGLKEWGREESAELQWCYPSLLNTSMQDDNGEDIQGQQGRDEAVESKIRSKTVSIIAPAEDSATHKGQELPPRKKVTIMGGESPLCRSPIKHPFKHHIDTGKKATRTSGLDCGDIDPFAQTDSFVYLAVSARPPTSHGEVTAAMLKGSPREVRKEIAAMQSEGVVAGLDQAQLLQEVKAGHLVPQKPEEGDFLCTDSFVYLAAPACLLLGPPGTTGYSGRDSDSESSDSGPVEVSVHGCGSVAGDSDWDSDLSDSDPTRPPRTTSSGTKASSGTSRSKRPPTEPQWDMYEDPPEPECIEGLGAAPSSPVASPSSPTIATMTSTAAAGETSTNAKRVTWQFKPAQRSVCTGSRKEKEVTSPHRPPPSSSSSSSSSSPSSSSG